MASEPLNKTEDKEDPYFLRLKTAAVYITLFSIGLFMVAIDEPGSPFIVISSGLFFGHVIFRTFVTTTKAASRIAAFSFTIYIIIGELWFFNFNFTLLMILSTMVFSIFVEWLGMKIRG